VKPIDITKTIEYKVDARGSISNLPGERTMLSGDPEYIFNLYSDNPQMSAGSRTDRAQLDAARGRFHDLYGHECGR
jgi:hypothetical protein